MGQLIGLDYSKSPYLRGVIEDAKQLQSRAYTYFSEFITRVSRIERFSAVLLCLEDLHWADAGSIEMLSHLAGELSDIPLLLLCTSRGDFLPIEQKRDTIYNIILSPLSVQECYALIAEIMNKLPIIPRHMIEIIAHKSEGIPYFIEELLRMIIDHSGKVTSDLSGGGGKDSINIPPTLKGILQSRLDALPSNARELIERASIVGPVFWDAALADLCENTCEGIAAGLELLCSREFIDRDSESLFSGTSQFRFRHTMMMETAYDSVLRRNRPKYHADIARWLVNLGGERAEEHAGFIARHYELAEDVGAASEWYAKAGGRSLDRFALASAIQAYKSAEKCNHENNHDSLRYSISEGLGKAYLFNGEYSQALVYFENMLSLAEKRYNLIGQARACTYLSTVNSRLNKLQDSLANAENAVLLSEKSIALSKTEEERNSGQAELLISIYEMAWGRKMVGRDISQSSALCESALAKANEFQETPRLKRAKGNLLNCSAGSDSLYGNHEASRTYYGRALDIARSLDDRERITVYLLNYGFNYWEMGEYAEAEEIFKEGLQCCRKSGIKIWEPVALCYLAYAYNGMHKHETAEELLREAIKLDNESPDRAEMYGQLALAHVGQGKIEEAYGEAKDALDIVLSGGQPEVIPMTWRILGTCSSLMENLHGLNEPSQKKYGKPPDCFAEALRLCQSIQYVPESIRIYREWAEHEERDGNPVEASRLRAKGIGILHST